MNDKLWMSFKKDIQDYELRLGPHYSYQVLDTPRHMLFSLARYKFAAKMLPRDKNAKILEFGCQEGIGTIMLAEAGQHILGVDLDREAILYAQQNIKKKNICFRYVNFMGKRFGKFKAVISLDVIEHIPPRLEGKFLKTICMNLESSGFALIGTPNIASRKYASKYSRMCHVNLYTMERLDKLLCKYFQNVFIFSMNDEVVHTGFYPMAHYLLAIASVLKKR